jgi:hypothetical protein
MDELREALDEAQMSTLMKMLRDTWIVVSRKDYVETTKHTRSVLGLPKDDSCALAMDSVYDDRIVALNPAVVEEMRKRYGRAELSYHMVRNFMADLLGQLELTSQVGSLNEFFRDLSSTYEAKFKVAVAKDIVMSYSCNLTEAEKASLTAARLISPVKFSGVISILLSRARRLAQRISLELTEEDIVNYIRYDSGLSSVGTVESPEDLFDRTP